MAGDRTFSTHRNLAFYPYNDVEINFSDHFVYFNLLIEYMMENNKLYNDYSQRLGHSAQNALESGFLGKNPEEGPESQIEKFRYILQIMSKGVELERAAEIKYINERMNDLINSFGNDDLPDEVIKIKEILKEATQGDKIDYPGLIIVLNSLLKGISNTKALFSYEQKRLDNWEQQLKKYNEEHLDQLQGLEKKKNDIGSLVKYDENGQRYAISDRDQIRQERYYLEHHSMGDITGTYGNYKGMKQYLEQVEETADIKIAKWLNENLNKVIYDKKIFNSVVDILQNHIIDALKNNSYAKTGELIKTGIIKIFLIYAEENIDKILSGELKKLEKKDIEQICISSINNPTYSFTVPIEGLYNNFGYYRNDINMFDEKGKPTGSFAGAYTALNKIRKAVENNKKNKKLHDQVLFLNRLKKKGGDSYAEIIKTMDSIDELEEQIKKISEAFSKGINTAQSRYLKINGTNLEVILDENGKLQFADKNKAKEILGDINLSTNLKSMIAQWKKRVGKQIKDLIIKINTTAKGNIKTSMTKKAQEALENVRINISGPDLSEVIEAVNITNKKGTLTISWNGKDMKKNDLTIVVEPPKIDEIKTDFSTTILNSLGNQPEDIIRNGLKDFYSDVREVEQEAVKKSHKKVNYEKDKNAFFNASDNFKKLLKESMQISEDLNTFLARTDQATAEKRKTTKAMLEKFKESFYISNTAKTINTYRNDIGFVGGTLASSGLLEQLNNLNDIFIAAGAGISQKDMDWLITAILNAGDHMLGKDNRNLIETYLGSMAIFALFNEGAAEAEIINKLIKNSYDHIQDATPQIMHLYHLNSSYYPGSFVLDQALNGVAAVIEELEKVQQVSNHNSNIRINNPIGPNILPNKKTLNPTDLHPWETVRDAALKKVTINIVFLAGLIDILKTINQKIEEIQL